MLAPSIEAHVEAPGSPTDPLRFDDQDLTERELSYGRSMFALQFQLDQTLQDIDRYPLKINDLIVTDLDPEFAFEKYVWCNDPDKVWMDLPCVGMAGDRFHRPLATVGDQVKYSTTVLSVDPSGRGADETAVSVVASTPTGQLCVLECTGIKGGFEPEVLEQIAHIAKRTKVNLILCEANLGAGMFGSLLQPWLAKIYRCPIEEVTHSIQKEKRICDVLEPLLNSHSLILDRSVVQRDAESASDRPQEVQRQYQLLWQLSRIQRIRGALRHDDRLDALAMACQYFVQHVARDSDKEMKQRRDDAQEAMLREYLEAGPSKVILGHKPVEMAWVPQRP